MAKLRDPSFPFYAGDWLSGQSVDSMTLAEQGAFIRLLCHAWLSGTCTLPDDPAVLGALSRMGEEYFRSEPCPLRRCFKARNGKIYNEKLTKLWKERQEHRRKSQEGGINSGKSRRSGTKGTSSQVRSKREPNANQKASLRSASSFASSSSSSISILDASLARVRAETLADTGSLLAWIDEAVAAGALDGSQHTRDRVAALAVRCRERGRNGGGGLFTTLMREGKFDHASNDDFDSAVAEIAEHERPAPRSDSFAAGVLQRTVPSDAPPPRNVETIRKLAEGAR